MVNKHYRFIHILWRSPKIFAPRIIDFITDSSNGFSVEEHAFVTTHKELFNQYCEKSENIFYADGYSYDKGAKLINDCDSKCDWLIVHCMCPPNQFAKIKKSIVKKIVWRTWGGDAGYTYNDNNFIKNSIKCLFNRVLAGKYRMIHCIGGAGTTDVVDIRSKFGDIDVISLPYGKGYEALEAIKTIKCQIRKNNTETRVMIGHSGYKTENHIKILKKLYIYNNENIHIFLSLSYGNAEYIKKVTDYALRLFGDKVTTLTDFMPFNDYCKLISTMDIGIFDAHNSNGLGNISIFKAFEKKIYLNTYGCVSKAFEIDGIPFVSSSIIGKENFDEFSTPLKYPIGFFENYIEEQDHIRTIDIWKKIFASLTIT